MKPSSRIRARTPNAEAVPTAISITAASTTSRRRRRPSWTRERLSTSSQPAGSGSEGRTRSRLARSRSITFVPPPGGREGPRALRSRSMQRCWYGSRAPRRSPRSRGRRPIPAAASLHAALTAPPFAAMTTTRTRVRPSEFTLLVAGGDLHASLCLSAEGPPDLCDRASPEGDAEGPRFVRSSVHCVALGRAGVHHWRCSRHCERDQGREGGPLQDACARPWHLPRSRVTATNSDHSEDAPQGHAAQPCPSPRGWPRTGRGSYHRSDGLRGTATRADLT